MSLRLIFGRAGTGKSTFCLNEIRHEIESDPLGAPLILLVPEQATHQMEMILSHDPNLGGTLRAQVLSFRRLGWRIFSETGGGQDILIGDVGKRMLLRRLLLKHRSELRIFARSATRPGMADTLAQAIAEFKIYRIEPRDLLQVQDTNDVLNQKLAEISFLYEEFNKALGQGVRDPDDELTLVASKIPDSDSLKRAKIWVDGFKGFTPQELYILEALLGVVAQVNITLPIDPDIIRRSPVGKSGIFRPGEEIFSGSWQTYVALRSMAREIGVEMEEAVPFAESHRFKNPELRHLEKYYNLYPTQVYEEESISGIHLFSAVNRRSEVEGVAREIRRLARVEGQKFSDIAVMTRDLTGYQAVIEQVFRAYEIPIFLDHKHSVLTHPLIELLLSALETARLDFAYEPLFRCLKTDFFPVKKDALDRLENYCLAYGIRGDFWRSGEDWDYHHLRIQSQELVEQNSKEQEIINEARVTIYGHLSPLMEALETKPLTVRQITESLYDFLLRLEVPKTLKTWSEKAGLKGNLAEARLQDQIWEAIIGLLDEMVVGFGDESIELTDYALILSSGLESLKLGLIPPGSDQVLIGSLERSRNPEVDVLFLIGANEGILPAKPSSEGILDEVERARLESLGLLLAPKGKAQLFEEQYFIYSALTRGKDRLYISYPLTDEEGKGYTVSPVVTRIKTIFPDLKEVYLGHIEDDLSHISHPYPLLTEYAVRLMQHKENETLPPLWKEVQKWYQNHEAQYPQAKLLETGIAFINVEEKIPKPLATRLYGKKLVTSVTRLEKFARCPFAHYAQYGLKLKERSTFQLKSPDMGLFFHAILNEFALTIRERNLDWGVLNKDESWSIVSELAEKIAPNLQNGIFLRGARYRYITHKLKRTVHHAVRVLGEHARRGVFVPIQLEVRFGPEENIPGLEVPLSDENMLILQGQIDRIDGAVFENTIYLRIIDYKSRQARVNLNRMIYGLDIQLLAYLDAALQGAQVVLGSSGYNDTAGSIEGQALEVQPAGFLYFPVVEPQLEAKNLLSYDQIDHERLKAVKVKGYLLANQQVLEAMDKDLSPSISGNSDLLGIKLTKEGDFKKGSPVITEDQFLLLQKHLYHFLQKTGEEILGGNVSISPYRQGKENACQYCSYKPVCHFDTYSPENGYRNLPQLEDGEIWRSLEALSPVGQELKLEEFNQKEPNSDEENHKELNWLGDEDLQIQERREPNE